MEILRYYKSILVAWCDLCNLGDDDELKLLNAGSYDGRSPITLATPLPTQASPNPQPHLFRFQAPRPQRASTQRARTPPLRGLRETRHITTIMTSSPPLIYAELLPNIRQISVLAALPTPSDGTTRVSLSADRAVLTLVHNAATASLQLPGAIAPEYTPTQPHPSLAQLSWRIPLGASPSQPRAAPSLPAPWSAGALASTSSFSCRGCGQVILPPGRVTTWRDLPSENWAEMMEFWHCHKPDVPVGEKGEEGGDNTTKGYGANTRMMAQKRVGKVDLTYFLLDTEDCSGLEVRVFDILVSAGSLWFSYVRASRRRPASLSLQWQGHRYKCPIATPPLRPRMASVPSHTENGLLCHQASLASA